MKTFPSNFDAEKNKKTGASPVWILKCPFATGTIYLSDQPFTITGWDSSPTTKPWVHTWGQVDESISNSGIDGIKISDFDMTLINDPDDASNILSILENSSNAPETTDCELYLWFLGLNASTDPPQLMWVGNILDWEEADELLINVQLVDQAVRFNKYIGNKVTETDYPYADEDDFDRVIPIVFGDVEKCPAVCVYAGMATTIGSAGSTWWNSAPPFGGVISVKDASRFPTGSQVVRVDDELILIDNPVVLGVGTTFNIIQRGYGGTTEATHKAYAPIYENISECFYIIADHTLSYINSIYARSGDYTLNITDVVIKYNGTHGSYPNKAVVEIPVKITKMQAEDILIENGIEYETTDLDAMLDSFGETTIRELTELAENISIGDGTHSHTVETTSSGSTKYRATSATGGTNPANAIDGSQDTWATISPLGSLYITFSTVASADRTWVWVKASNYTEIKVNTITIATISVAQHDVWVSFLCEAGISSVQIYNPTGTNKNCYEVELEHEGVVAQGTAAESSTSASTEATNYQDQDAFVFTGNSVANAYIGDVILADVYKTFNQSAWDAIRFLLIEYAGWTGSLETTGGNGSFNGIINEYKKLKDWCDYFAFQEFYYFRFYKGQPSLISRDIDGLYASKSIMPSHIKISEDGKTTLKITRAGLNEILNKITVLCDRDWSKSKDEDAYAVAATVQDDTSIARYGEKEQADLFYFDFIIEGGGTTAEDLANIYVSYYKDRKKNFICEVFLDNSELEFGDIVYLQARHRKATWKCMVMEADILPGSGMEMRNDNIRLLLREIEPMSDTTAPYISASPSGGTFNVNKTITLSYNEQINYVPAFAVIHYTLDGTEPSTLSPIYTSPLLITQTTTLKFFAIDVAGNQSAVQTQTYTIDKTAPVTLAAPTGGTYTAAQSVILTANETATIYYTTNGSTPTTSSNVYSAPININATTTLKFFAKDTAGNQEAVKTEVYTLDIDFVAPVTTASPPGAWYIFPITVTLTANEPATIYYTIDGTTPTMASPVYAAPIYIADTTTLKFFAKDTAGNQEAVKTEFYSSR